MNRIIELHAASAELLTQAQAELKAIAEISRTEGDQYEKDIMIKEHKIKMQKVMRSYYRTITAIQQIIQGEIL